MVASKLVEQGTLGSGRSRLQHKGRKKHWPGKVFKSVIFPAISLSWCVASGLTGPPCPGEHELEQGLSLSSSPILAHHLHPGEIHGEDQAVERQR